MSIIFLKRENLNTDPHQRRSPGEDEDRDQPDASTDHETPITGIQRLNWREAWNGLNFKILRKNLLCQHHDLGILAPPKL